MNKNKREKLLCEDPPGNGAEFENLSKHVVSKKKLDKLEREFCINVISNYFNIYLVIKNNPINVK